MPHLGHVIVGSHAAAHPGRPETRTVRPVTRPHGVRFKRRRRPPDT